MKYVLFILVLLSPMTAIAQDLTLETLCASLPEYRQAEGVEYVPGAEAVVRADLNPLNAAVPDIIDIPITVQLAERFPDLNIPADLQLEPNVALLSVHKNGRVEYNGQDVSGQIYTTCEKEQSESETAHGQQGEDILSSEPKVIEIKDGIKGEVLEGQYP